LALPAFVRQQHNLISNTIKLRIFFQILNKEPQSMPAKGWIEVNDQYCKGCELCITACPPQVMALDKERLTPKGYHPAQVFKEGCTGCAICAIVCPDAAITVYREVTKSAAQMAAAGG
jgi:2-oxoglutarate ferredoxin oxidoreductase subunit delta